MGPRMATAEEYLERLLAQVIPEPNSGCWIWLGAARGTHGSMSFRGQQGAPVHRVAYTLMVGEIPENIQVLHRCDMGICVNPKHFFLGTQRDNMRDMVAKGRHKNRSRTAVS